MSGTTGTLAVVGQTGRSLSFFDLSTGERTAQLNDLIAEPHELCFDRRRNLLYISHTYRHGHYWVHDDYAHEISVVDCTTKTVVDTIDVFPTQGPHGLILDEEKDILYACVEELVVGQGGGVIGIDLKSKSIIKKVESQSKPHWFVITPDGRKAYTCNKSQPFISVLDLEKENFSGKLEVSASEELGVSLDGKFVFVPTPGLTIGPPPADASIKVVDTTLDEIIKSIPTGLGPQVVRMTSSGRMMVAKYSYGASADGGVASAQSGRLALYSPDTHEFLGEAAVGKGPLTIRSSPEGETAFVANIFDGTVTVINLTSMTVVQTLSIDDKPTSANTKHPSAHGLAMIV
ncbi:hypothetical protein ACLMJK_006587 [Lecanora helva]